MAEEPKIDNLDNPTDPYIALDRRVKDLENLVGGLNPRNLGGIRNKDILQLTAANVFGDGSDGEVIISGNTTITRDMFYENLTVNSTITLTTASFRVFVKNTLTNKGTIKNDGGAGGTGGDSTVDANPQPAGGAIGTAVGVGSLPVPAASGVGDARAASNTNGNGGGNRGHTGTILGAD